MFDTTTQAAIRLASTTPPDRLTRRESVLLMLAGGEWVGGLELALKAGQRVKTGTNTVYVQ